MGRKNFYKVLFLSFLLAISFPEIASAKSQKKGRSKAQTNASAKEKEKQSQERSEAKSPLALGLDSIFIAMKKDLDDMAASPVIRGKSISPVNSYFLKTLKENQPFYSLTRVNAMGDGVNEMIRLVEKADEKKQNFSKELWFKQAAKKHVEYSSMIKLEESGRYHLVWAIPIIDKNQKSKEPFEGALALKIDLWDCFHKFANNIETPFLIRIDRLHLYSNKWKDSIAYKEELLKVPGAQKVFVRYPKDMTAIVATAPAPAPAMTAPEVPAIDSAKIKAAQDSLKTAKIKEKKKGTTRTIIIAVLIVLIIIVAILLFIVAPAMKQRAIMKNIDRL